MTRQPGDPEGIVSVGRANSMKVAEILVIIVTRTSPLAIAFSWIGLPKRIALLNGLNTTCM
jgi:hypothetical protein